jgi:hypothetical protein
MIVPRAAFNLAMAALEDSNDRYLRACRAHVGDLMAIGLTMEQVEGILAPLDVIEAEQDGLVEHLWELAHDAA